MLPEDASHQTFSKAKDKSVGQALKKRETVQEDVRRPRPPAVASSILNKIPSDMRASINASADPCTDFYEFSCGRWLERTSIPSWQSSWAKQWDGVTTDVEHKTVQALHKDPGPAGVFFRSCMDTPTIQKLGNAPLKPWLHAVELVKDHPSFMQSLARFALSDMTVFFGWWVDADSVDSSINSFFIAQGGITMPDRSYYLDSSKSMAKRRLAFKTMVLNIMQLAGRTRAEAVDDANNVMEVETAIAKAMKDNTAERDEHGERTSVSELQQLVPSIDWKEWLRTLGCPDVGSGNGRHLIVKNKEFLKQVEALIKSAGYAKIKSYLRWQAVYSFAPYLSFPFEDELVRYNNEIYGISQLPPRWRKCFFSTGEAMDMHVSRVFVQNFFPESSRRHALDMLMQIREQFNGTLQRKDWMDKEAREKAVDKLQHMFLEVGHPSVWPPSAFEDFKSFGGIREHAYFENIVATNAFDVRNALSRLGKKVDRRRWGSSSATDVNSYYSRKVNGIFIPAGILQPPFYSPAQAMARNYGSVGCICGHEMTHGFDDIGREYDADGNRNGWWDEQVVKNFKERAKCISQLFSSYEVDGKHVNGELTLGEAIADSGGLKFSWESFLHAYQPSHLDRMIFFIAMGQTWCEKLKPQGAVASLLTDQHPPSKFRVIGTLSQFAPFAETFQCPVGSPMNPVQRCHLW